MTAFYLILMTLNSFCAVLLFLSGLQKQKRYFFTLALLNVLALLFHWFSLKQLSSTSLEAALYYSRIHTAIVLIWFPLFTYTFSAWSQFRYTKPLVQFITAIVALLLLVNATSAYPLRFGEVSGLARYTTVFGDTAYSIVGSSSQMVALFHGLVALNIITVLIFAYHFFRARKSAMSVVLLCAIILQMFSTYTGFNIDNQQSSLVYLGGVPVTFISLICVLLLSYSLKQKTVQLDEQTQRRIALETAFARLAEDVSIENPEQFYLNTLQTLYEFSHADFILIGLVGVHKVRRAVFSAWYG